MNGPAAAGRPRGEPLLVLGAILGGWLALRIVLWQPPFAFADFMPLARSVPVAVQAAAAEPAPTRIISVVPARSTVAPAVPGPIEAPNMEPLPPPWLTEPAPPGTVSAANVPPVPARREIGQQLLLAAAFANMDLPPEVAAFFAPARAPAAAPATLAGEQPLLGRGPVKPAAAGRWSGDGWLLLRAEGNGPLAAGVPSYGRSQAGAIVRYRLAPSSGHRPLAYARVTRALAGSGESELAAGLGARPVARVPLSVAAEVRVYDGSAGREVRPAAFVVTELPAARLPLGLRAEAYAQGGYVGGRFATAFVDGQARVDRRVARLGNEAEVRAGAGVWGGAQKHAARLDVGPSAIASFRLGATRSRVAVDYRVRIAGEAEPKSGPALTISAGF
jgi:hypothetical protein